MAAIDNPKVLKKEWSIMGLGMKMGEGHRGYDRPTHEKNSLTHPSLLPLRMQHLRHSRLGTHVIITMTTYDNL